jgi:hypothetical protein
VLVMVSSYSRFIMARMTPSRMTGDLLAAMWELLGSLGGVPRDGQTHCPRQDRKIRQNSQRQRGSLFNPRNGSVFDHR